MISEIEQQTEKQKRAIETFIKVFGGSYQKLSPNDVDYKLLDKSGEFYGYAQIIPRVRTMFMAYPLPVEAKKVMKLTDKRTTGIIIWCCEDGIIYGKPTELRGQIKFDLPASELSIKEMMIYYEKQRGFGYVRYS